MREEGFIVMILVIWFIGVVGVIKLVSKRPANFAVKK